ncbi:MAG: 30S ribosomal protein S3 [Candidatus Brennerbacteria bacterium]|nr:30S ribosomal protein S3 [Candidatus Brennerbacteria bacterium]
MAQKTRPNSFRLGITKPWQSQWFFKRSLRFFVEEDHLIRKVIKDKILVSGIDGIEIERTGELIKVTIRSARPGLIIGRGGKGIEDLKETLLRSMKALRQRAGFKGSPVLNLNVEEIKRMELSASVLAQQMAFDIEKRLPYRMVMKRHLEIMKQNRGVKGAKIRMAGRLNGAEIARRDSLHFGQMPLQTLRANIDYGEATAFTTYGTIGIKVWLYKGEIFDNHAATEKTKA